MGDEALARFRADFFPEVEWVGDPIRVLVCDDHALFRRGLVVVLEDEPDLEVVGEADSGPESAALAEELAPDVVLCDLAIPPYGGVAAASQISRAVPMAAIVLMAVDEKKPDELVEGFGAGAVGLVLKEAALDMATDTARRVVRREVVVTPAVAGEMAALVGWLNEPVEPGAPQLQVPDRERAAVDVIAGGAGIGDLGRELDLPDATARNLLANLVHRLQRYWRLDEAVVSLSAPTSAPAQLVEVAEAARRVLGEDTG